MGARFACGFPILERSSSCLYLEGNTRELPHWEGASAGPSELESHSLAQDLLVASLFRNFLLADRIMRAASCTPASYPRLPSTHQHPMWQVRICRTSLACGFQ